MKNNQKILNPDSGRNHANNSISYNDAPTRLPDEAILAMYNDNLVFNSHFQANTGFSEYSKQINLALSRYSDGFKAVVIKEILRFVKPLMQCPANTGVLAKMSCSNVKELLQNILIYLDYDFNCRYKTHVFWQKGYFEDVDTFYKFILMPGLMIQYFSFPKQSPYYYFIINQKVSYRRYFFMTYAYCKLGDCVAHDMMAKMAKSSLPSSVVREMRKTINGFSDPDFLSILTSLHADYMRNIGDITAMLKWVEYTNIIMPSEHRFFTLPLPEREILENIEENTGVPCYKAAIFNYATRIMRAPNNLNWHYYEINQLYEYLSTLKNMPLHDAIYPLLSHFCDVLESPKDFTTRPHSRKQCYDYYAFSDAEKCLIFKRLSSLHLSLTMENKPVGACFEKRYPEIIEGLISLLKTHTNEAPLHVMGCYILKMLANNLFADSSIRKIMDLYLIIVNKRKADNEDNYSNTEHGLWNRERNAIIRFLERNKNNYMLYAMPYEFLKEHVESKLNYKGFRQKYNNEMLRKKQKAPYKI